ncbi:MAG TPA: ATP-dependent sacrificial sulfur transferase LarE [Acidobacteriaceae bacterium]|nr:ATP-dependent sacrificial sulfur transferase LarE [Acidobacteriaceae bacterium]
MHKNVCPLTDYFSEHASQLVKVMLQQKEQILSQLLSKLDGLLVAYSGGVDSAYLAFAAHRALGGRMLAVLADSPSLSRSHMRDAISFAAEQGFALRVVSTRELERPEYVRNDGARCFHCKDELFGVMSGVARDTGFSHLAYGMNLDDRGDLRPGQHAAKQHGVLAPLVDAGLTKEDVRSLARQAGLRIWNKPASACLSSRVAYGNEVTADVLRVIEDGEEALYALGFRQFRVRHHGDTARIEIAREELEHAFSLAMFDEITRCFKALGFKYVALDTEGYRSGSMNALLSPASIQHARTT